MSLVKSASSSENINVMVVIDTDYIKKNYTNPSKDPNKPTGINHASQFMICNSPRGIVSGQGTADLNFKANPGDYVSFRGTSIYGNSDDAVIVYGIKYWSGDQVFNTFVTNLVEREKAIQPDVNSLNGLPPKNAVADFVSYDSLVRKSGKENFYVYIALYTLADDGNTQTLYGYFYWDPSITV